MWLLLTLLILFLVVSAAGMPGRPRSRSTDSPAGGPGFQTLDQHQGKIRGLRIGVDCASAADFTLRRYRLRDLINSGLDRRQLPNLGVPRRRRLVLITDDPRISPLITATPQLIEAFTAGLQPDAAGLMVSRLVGADGQLWVEVEAVKPLPSSQLDLAALTAHWQPILQALATALAEQAAAPHAGDLQARRLVQLGMNLSYTLTAVGALQLWRILISDAPVLLDGGRFWDLARSTSLVLVLGSLIYARLRFGASTRLQHAVGAFLVFGGVAVLTNTYVLLREANVTLDFAPATPVAARVESAWTSTCGIRQQSTCYRVQLQFAPASGVAARSVEVSETVYRQLPTGTTLSIPLHAGALGVRWIGALSPELATPAPR